MLRSRTALLKYLYISMQFGWPTMAHSYAKREGPASQADTARCASDNNKPAVAPSTATHGGGPSPVPCELAVVPPLYHPGHGGWPAAVRPRIPSSWALGQ